MAPVTEQDWPALGEATLDTRGAVALARLLGALADPIRLRLISILAERVVVLGSNPGRILGELDARDVHPSSADLLDNTDYRRLRHRAIELLGELP